MSVTLRWVGRLPSSWAAIPLKAVARYFVSNVDKISAEDELPVRLCNYTDVYNNEFITPQLELMRSTATPGEITRFQLKEHDVVITKGSESWDDIAIPALVVETQRIWSADTTWPLFGLTKVAFLAVFCSAACNQRRSAFRLSWLPLASLGMDCRRRKLANFGYQFLLSKFSRTSLII